MTNSPLVEGAGTKETLLQVVKLGGWLYKSNAISGLRESPPARLFLSSGVRGFFHSTPCRYKPSYFLGRTLISGLLPSVLSQRLYRGLTRRSKQKVQVKDPGLRHRRLANGAFLQGILDGKRGLAGHARLQTLQSRIPIFPPDGRAMTRLSLTSIGVRNHPHNPHVVRFSPNHLEFRPWRPSLNGLTSGRALFQR